MDDLHKLKCCLGGGKKEDARTKEEFQMAINQVIGTLLTHTFLSSASLEKSRKKNLTHNIILLRLLQVPRRIYANDNYILLFIT